MATDGQSGEFAHFNCGASIEPIRVRPEDTVSF